MVRAACLALVFSSFATLAHAQGVTVPEGYEQSPQQPYAQPVYPQPGYPQPAQQPPPHAQLDQPPPGPQRSGFTIELSIGFALTQFQDAGSCMTSPTLDCASYTVEAGLAPLALGIGAFITESFALLFRASGTSFIDSDRLMVLGHYGVTAQFWPSDWLMLSFGPALALFGDLEGNADVGFGIDARVGFSFLSLAHHSFRASIELYPSFFEEFVMGESLVFEWQFY